MMKFINSTRMLAQPEDGYDFFLLHIPDYLPYIIMNIIGTICGVLGNILIIGSILCTKKLHTRASIIIANIALADLFISSITDTFAVAGKEFLIFLFFYL